MYRNDYGVYPWAQGPNDPYYNYDLYHSGMYNAMPMETTGGYQHFYPDYQQFQTYDMPQQPIFPTHYDEQPFIMQHDQQTMTPSQKQMLMQYFQDENGEVDLDKVFKTLGQVVQITQQVSPLLKGLNSMVRDS
ncbi:YppG family protein [Alkalibacillus silvisoli]|uniref:Spore coat protein n=1 Tax=Alkalibacillus silvisoli TaxID=392823 RepID=A0ABN0ZM73_9BACI